MICALGSSASPDGFFTANRIAEVIGRRRQSVQSSLEGIPPAGQVLKAGQLTNAWAFHELPEPLRTALDRRALKLGYPDSFSLLKHHRPNQWEPPVPLSQVPAKHIETARKLQCALGPTLRRLEETCLTMGEIEDLGFNDYKEAFGHSVSARHFRRLLKRTQERDSGNGEWSRLELYLPDKVARRKTPSRIAVTSGQWQPILDLLNSFTEVQKPTPKESGLFWNTLCQVFEAEKQTATDEPRLKRSLLLFVSENAPFVSPNPKALSQQFRRKFNQWKRDGLSGIKDQRKIRSGRRNAPPIPEDFRKLLIARAINRGGRISQAWRELYHEGKLPPLFYEFYCHNWEAKSHVPRRIRDAVSAEVNRLKEINLGPKAAKLKGPKVVRDWSDMPSGVQAQSDDCTLPVYFWIEDANSRSGFKLLRGQFLPWIDTRTTYIHCFQLLPKESYSSLDIVRGIARLNNVYGLPEELYFERGIWQKSLLISGSKDEVSWDDRVYGLSDLGIRITHALDPSAKVVERVLGALQNRMEGERGYCGRNERLDCPEHVQKAQRLVKAGKAHPGQYFYSYTEWVERLNLICNDYNDEPQNGKMLNGLSPRNGFVNYHSGPPARLDGRTRYLIATNRRRAKVTAQGVTIRIGKNTFNYKSEATGALRSQPVLAWFDVEDPEYITLTDMNQNNPVTVPRSTPVPAYRADPETIAQAKRECAAHSSHDRALYSDLKKVHPEEFGSRNVRTLADVETIELGEAMTEQREQLKEERKKQDQLNRRLRKYDRDNGRVTLGSSKHPERKLRGYELLEEAKAE